MIAPNETKLTYRKATIRIVNQPQTVVVYWESTIDASKGQLEVSRANWADGEIVRLVMETIDRCCKKHQRLKNLSRS